MLSQYRFMMLKNIFFPTLFNISFTTLSQCKNVKLVILSQHWPNVKVSKLVILSHYQFYNIDQRKIDSLCEYC